MIRLRIRPVAHVLALLCLLTLAWTLPVTSLRAEETTTPFSKLVIDIGVVVSNLDKSAAFYTNIIGFRETSGFNVPPDMGKKIGLTDHLGVKIRVFELGEGNTATKIKLMAFPDAGVAKPDRHFIHSTLGLNYLTIYCTDLSPTLGRLKAADVKLLGESPVALGGGTFLVTFQDPDGSFIELIGSMKAP